jgi:ABC-type Fe3+/spermidine/putrescine transport system ATPase subunit
LKLTLEGIGKRFGDLTVLDGIDLSVGEGEVLALLGWSGSGKTTLLRVLAGFETPDRGRVTVDGEEVTHQPPARRGFSMVFQHYALFPHLTVGDNVAFGLESRGAKGPGVAERVAHVLSLVDLAGFAERKVGEISGGQQQRVALARALAPEPRILLLDEPLSNLDPTLRERTRRELKALIREVGITTVLVTHEQEEAFDLGDRVAVLHQGRLHQVGLPEELYEEPATRFVATFVGRSAILPGTYAQGGVRLDLPGKPVWPGYPVPEDGQLGPRVHLIVRPEALALSRKPSPSSLAGKVVDRRYAGVVTYCTIALDEGPEVEVLTSTHAAEIGDPVHVRLRPDSPEPRIYHRD